MSDDITDQAERVLRLRWEQPGPDYPEPVPTGLVWLGDWASEYLGGLVAELKTTRQFRYQVADALGFVECVEGVGNAILADDAAILDYVRAQAETARKHETECPVWCDDHEHFEHADSCKECGGSGVAIVALPTLMVDRSNVAESIKDRPMWEVGGAWTSLTDNAGEIEFEADNQNACGCLNSPAEARALAAVLLAASAAAEAVTDA